MREEIPTGADGSEEEGLAPSPSRLMQWVWPVLGSLSIGALVVMILQSPELSSKLGISGIPSPKTQVVVNMTTPAQKKVPQAQKSPQEASDHSSAKPQAPLETPTSASNEDIAKITTRLKDQNERIKKLETIVGAVTGSVAPVRKNGATPSSSVPKISPATSTEDVDHTHKTDSLIMPPKTLAPMPEKVEVPELKPVTTADSVQNTGDTKSAARSEAPSKTDAKKAETLKKPVKIAALSKAEKVEDDTETGGQYGVRLVIADKISKLKTAWNKLGKKGKGNELSDLKARVQKSKATNGKTIYALVAGPLPDMGEAIELCVRLKLKGIPCAQSDFTGDPL